MIEWLQNMVGQREFVPALLQAGLLIIFLFILFLIPTFELGTELAIFSATLAIVILSLLSAHYSEERTELLREQNEYIESQIKVLNAIEERNREQSDFLKALNNSGDSGEVLGDESEPDEDREVDKETAD